MTTHDQWVEKCERNAETPESDLINAVWDALDRGDIRTAKCELVTLMEKMGWCKPEEEAV